MTDRIRFTIAVDLEVHEAFVDMAEASGVSLSRCVGDWLRDTTEAAQLTTAKLRTVRESTAAATERFTMAIAREMASAQADPSHPLALALSTVERHRRARDGGEGSLRSGGPAPSLASPPSSNTGGKVLHRKGGRR